MDDQAIYRLKIDQANRLVFVDGYGSRRQNFTPRSGCNACRGSRFKCTKGGKGNGCKWDKAIWTAEEIESHFEKHHRRKGIPCEKWPGCSTHLCIMVSEEYQEQYGDPNHPIVTTPRHYSIAHSNLGNHFELPPTIRALTKIHKALNEIKRRGWSTGKHKARSRIGLEGQWNPVGSSRIETIYFEGGKFIIPTIKRGKRWAIGTFNSTDNTLRVWTTNGIEHKAEVELHVSRDDPQKILKWTDGDIWIQARRHVDDTDEKQLEVSSHEAVDAATPTEQDAWDDDEGDYFRRRLPENHDSLRPTEQAPARQRMIKRPVLEGLLKKINRLNGN